MKPLKPHYIVNHKGERISVVLSIKEYEALLAKLEELKSHKLYNSANTLNEPSVAYKQADEIDGDTDEEIRENIRAGFAELRLIKAGKVKTRPIEDLLNEL